MQEGYIKKLIEDGMRINGRSFEEFRPIKIETGVIKTAEGSARVTLGGTMVVVGVKMDVREPYPDSPNEGNLIVDVELVPLASPTFEPGPPDADAVEMARVVDRGIRESKAIDLEKLVVKEGELVWAVHIDIHVLDHDGNLIDAAALGAIAALWDTRIPEYDAEKKAIVKDGSSVVYTKNKLPMRDKPVEVTIFKIANRLFVDPCLEEDEAIEARITFATNEAGELCAAQKGGNGFFTSAEILSAADSAIKKGKELRKLL